MYNLLIDEEQTKKACKLLDDLTNRLQDSAEVVDRLTQAIQRGEYDTRKGISLLDLKNNVLAAYMTNFLHTTLLKLSGRSLLHHPVIDRLIEQRVIFERLGPYEHKLQYKIDECLKAQSDGEASSTLVKSSAPPEEKGLTTEDFALGDTDVEDNDSDTEELPLLSNSEEIKTYKVPKVSQNKFPGEEQNDEEKQQAIRRRILKSSMMQDALYEHCEDPDVIYNSGIQQRKAIKRREEITRYEEENFRRVRLSKKDRAELKGTTTAGVMAGELLGFSDVSLLDGSSGTDSRGSKKRKLLRKSGKSNGRKKKGKKRH